MNLFVRVRKDVRLFVEDLNINAEQTILLIHGWPLNHNMWEYEVEYLIEIGYRVVTIDLRGYGQSDRPKDGYDYDTMASDIKGIIDGPFYKGICNYKDSNVTLKIVAQCKEEDRFQVERDLMREYRRILLENNIDMSYQQVVINYAETKDYNSNTKSKKEAEKFMQTQKVLSKDLEEQENQ